MSADRVTTTNSLAAVGRGVDIAIHEGIDRHPIATPMPTLTAIPFSPWSEKARWALDYHSVDYEEAYYTPIFGEYALRLRMRRPFGRVTVPVFEDGGRWLRDSFEIAHHADVVGHGERLFHADRLAEITTWNDRSERALAAGRAILMQRWAQTPELAAAALPFQLSAMSGPLAALGRVLGRARLRSFMSKYDIREGDDRPRETLVSELDRLVEALSGGRTYLVGDRFSYADIAMALALQQVKPVDPRWIIRMEGLSPEGMNVPELEARYAPLFAWRDLLYARHRRPAPASPSRPNPV